MGKETRADLARWAGIVITCLCLFAATIGAHLNASAKADAINAELQQHKQAEKDILSDMQARVRHIELLITQIATKIGVDPGIK